VLEIAHLGIVGQGGRVPFGRLGPASEV
jgi:hypothetical protein